MIKEKYLKPLIERYDEFRIDVKASSSINFLKSATDEELKIISNSLFWIYPLRERNQLIRGNEKSFIKDFRKEYNISENYSISEKLRGAKLLKMLRENSELTAKEFIDKAIDKK